MRTPLCDELGIEFPIFAFSHCRDVVAAVSRAGGLGVLGAVAFSPEQLEIELRWIDEHVGGKPYGVDVVIPASYVGKAEGDLAKQDLKAMLPPKHVAWLEELLSRHGVPPLPPGIDSTEALLGWSVSKGRALVEVAMQHPIRLIANALGPPPADLIAQAHAADIKVAALVGRVDQALRQKEAGVDIIIASGTEAGGHTGEIGTMVLAPQVVDAVAPLPVLAAGGIGDGRQMLASLALGAAGVWCGSLWLTTREGIDSTALSDKLLQANSSDTVRSRCISGKPARMLKTAYTEAWDDADSPGTLPMPLQYMVTAEATHRIYRHAQTGGDATLLGTPVGQVVGMMNRVRGAEDVVREMVEDYLDSLDQLNAQLADLAGLADNEDA